MSDPVFAGAVSALGGVSFDGFATVREIGPVGMVTLRAKPDAAGLAEAVKAATGCKLPGQRRIVRNGERAVGWMSPDEWLLVVPHGEAEAVVAAVSAALKGQHHLAVNVSDARAVFRIEGSKADQVLRKLAPADIDRMEPDELRRTRIAQVAGAFWREGDGFTLVCFRSVAGYVMGLLTHSAQPGSELG
ncbi:sarcosine oxidase subunit gamma [Neotabrizicola shimadae]|uniref:Sarcosine oxidase subunit gamma n=1 Tax=Neotabrizicola shimadae TaxID=2807096 RepID=A0A8G1EDY2_9RHOB|nr:sarcosine oxidase subunit gamma family protein [Neotabrizicola shimadae]QYZ70676.1 sarcosine oxidase subunit gamma [Neotabrizicola shimadae]